MKKIRIPFNVKIGVVLFLIGAAPLLIGFLFNSYISTNFLKETAISNLREINKSVASQIEDFISTSFNDIEILRENPILKSSQVPFEEKISELNKIIKFYPNFQDINFLDEKGNVIFSTSFKFYGRWNTNVWFREAKNKREIVMSDIYAVLDPREPILSFFAPIFNEKKEISYFIAVQINMEKFMRILTSIKIGRTGYVFLINSYGDILTHPNRELLFEKISSSYPLKEAFEKEIGEAEFDFMNTSLIGSFRNIKIFEDKQNTPHWQVLVVQQKNEIFALSNSLRNRLFSLFILSFILIVILSSFISKNIIKPLKELTLIANKISQGNFNIQIKIERDDEFGDLFRAFDKMVKELKNSYSALEESKKVLEIRVKARTRELEEIAERQEEIIKERTRELQKKLEELEKIQKLVVGRELKMVKLKEEIEKLKKELKKQNDHS
jgi:methyl-accepting chemotaxis protein